MIKTLIVTGGKINKSFLKKYLEKEKFDNILAVDKGLEFLDELNILPNYIIGDFDSVNKNILKKYLNKKQVQIYKFESEKDYTDTNLAIKLAIKLKSKEIIILGAIGTRIDHTIANVSILCETLNKNIDTKIIDEYNKIQLINKKLEIKKEYRYLSILPFTNKVEGITLKGFKYNLDNYTLEIGSTIGISNEQIETKATIEIEKGILIVIQSKD